jgi:hypothetical protein
MIDLSKEIKKICNLPLKERHSYFQLQYFLIGKEPTIQSRLWRCVRELKSRKDTLISMEMEIEEINDDLEIIDISLKENNLKKPEPISIIQERKIKRQKKAKQIRLLEIQEKKKVIEEECAFLIKAFNKLEEFEKIKPYDDMESQKQYWNEKLSQEFNLRKQLGLPPDLELIKTILALNSDAIVRQDFLNSINSESKENDLLLEKTKNHSMEFQECKVENKEKNDI